MSEPTISRYEFDMFVKRFDDLVQRVNTMDSAGTHGMGGLEVTVQGIASDVAEHKTEHVRVGNNIRNLVIAMVAQVMAIIGTNLPMFRK